VSRSRSPARVFCVDDQASLRAALRALVAATPGLTHVGEAGSGEEAVDAVEKLRPDLVLMDVRMPGIDGFAAAAILAARQRDLVVVLISADVFDPPPGFAPRGGEICFVPKEELSPRRLLDVWHGRRTR
jgi:DNA-binding NarL/FixJ family response regulator